MANQEYITLGQFLKLTGMFESGGQIKHIIKKLDIEVNDEKENRRGRKLYAGDTVKVENRVFEIKND